MSEDTAVVKDRNWYGVTKEVEMTKQWRKIDEEHSLVGQSNSSDEITSRFQAHHDVKVKLRNAKSNR